MRNPFRCFNSSPEVIRLAVMMYVRYPLSLRQVEDLLVERGIDVCHETVRFWWNRFGPLFAGEIRRRRVDRRNWSSWRWHLDEVFVRINGEAYYLWRAVDHEGEVLEVFATKRRDRRAALKFLKRWSRRPHLAGSSSTDSTHVDQESPSRVRPQSPATSEKSSPPLLTNASQRSSTSSIGRRPTPRRAHSHTT